MSGFHSVFKLGARLAQWALLAALPAVHAGQAGPYTHANDIPPRQQWTANHGYCGEVGLISAGLYYGQYVSQYDARALASRSRDQARRDSQLLLGANDSDAAAHMHLQAVPWKGGAGTDATDFLAWVKTHVASGHPVLIGVYENLRLFEDTDDDDAGDAQYDHIVSVTGVSSTRPVTIPAAYVADDVLTFSDHGLWSPDDKPDYRYRYAFGAFQATRQEANAQDRAVYSLPRGVGNHGLAITGIIDRDGQTLPVRVATSANDEQPAMPEGGSARPASMPLTLTVTVSGLKPGVPYTLYRYDSFQAVPEAAFNGNASKASKQWKLRGDGGSTYTMQESIRSDQVAVYRAVPDSAP